MKRAFYLVQTSLGTDLIVIGGTHGEAKNYTSRYYEAEEHEIETIARVFKYDLVIFSLFNSAKIVKSFDEDRAQSLEKRGF